MFPVETATANCRDGTTRAASNCSAAQFGSLGSVNGVHLVTELLRTDQIRNEQKNVRSVSTLSNVIGRNVI